MTTNKFFLFLSLLAFLFAGLWFGSMACSTPSKANGTEQHLATKFVEMLPTAIVGKCTRWTDDSVLCKVSDTAIMWCEAPKKDKPHCEMAADWTPKPPEPPKPEADAPIAPSAAPVKRPVNAPAKTPRN